MKTEGYSIDAVCEECTDYSPVYPSYGDATFIGQTRAYATTQLKAVGWWISAKRRFCLCDKHNTREFRKKYKEKEGEA